MGFNSAFKGLTEQVFKPFNALFFFEGGD